MKTRQSALSVLVALSLALFILALAGGTPAVSTAFAEANGTGPVPADSSLGSDSLVCIEADEEPEEGSLIDALVDAIGAVL